MRIVFEQVLPVWIIILAVVALCVAASVTYRRPIVPLTRARRLTLISLRAATLLLLFGIVLRPTLVRPAPTQDRPAVPILVDGSQSMRILENGQRRVDAALQMAYGKLVPTLSRDFRPEVFAFGDRLTTATRDLSPDARHSDLASALEAVRKQYAGQAIPGVIVLTDGALTSPVPQPSDGQRLPVFAVGVGEADGLRDREILDITSGEATLAESIIELSVSAVSRGFGAAPLEIRLLENGRPIDIRRTSPVRDGSPVRELFAVAPHPQQPTLYTVQIPDDTGEMVAENNVRSILIRPPGRKRRILVLEGAPGHEHNFLKRAWALDTGLEVDSIVRKGKNERGEDTFFVQAPPARASSLSAGFPSSRQALFAYDSIVLANIEASFLSTEQLQHVVDFVAERGGGLLLLGARSFVGERMRGTPLEPALPLELSDRGDTTGRSVEPSQAAAAGKLQLTSDGAVHPMMRLSLSAEENRRRWSLVPPVASSVGLGPAKPGALLLAVTGGPAGSVRPLIAVQRYGRGRSMVFAGEAAWRWRMLMPAADRTHEIFWRQVARWLAMTAPEPVSVVAEGSTALPEEPIRIVTTVLDPEFRPRGDASVTLAIRRPDGSDVPAVARVVDPTAGRYEATVNPGKAGVYQVNADVRRGSERIGTARDTFLVGGTNLEFADPRMNADLLRRLAETTGGAFVAVSNVDTIPSLLRQRVESHVPLERRPLWHHPLLFATIVLLLACEWVLRRGAGLL